MWNAQKICIKCFIKNILHKNTLCFMFIFWHVPGIFIFLRINDKFRHRLSVFVFVTFWQLEEKFETTLSHTLYLCVCQVCFGRRSPASARDGSSGGRHRAHAAHHHGNVKTVTFLFINSSTYSQTSSICNSLSRRLLPLSADLSVNVWFWFLTL